MQIEEYRSSELLGQLEDAILGALTDTTLSDPRADAAVHQLTATLLRAVVWERSNHDHLAQLMTLCAEDFIRALGTLRPEYGDVTVENLGLSRTSGSRLLAQ